MINCLRPLTALFRARRRYYGLDELDRKLERFLDFDCGTFVEAGANDGVRQSNTLYFETFRRWRGLLIEPVPDLAHRCRRRRRAPVENVALVPFGFSESSIELEYCDLMSTVQGAMQSESARREHVRIGCDVQRIQSQTLRVPCAPLSDVLDRHGISQIDLLSLDVEGFELQALQGLDLVRHAPRWMLIEARFREPIDAYLHPRYEPVAELSHHDVLYRTRTR